MIDKILEFAVRQRVLVLMGALALLLAGLWSANKLPMDAIPDITGVQVQVNTTVPALAPDEVEKLVTVPLEMALGGVAGVTEMRSLSRFGLSQITLQFTDKTDVYRARQLVTERLQTAGRSFLLQHRLLTERNERACHTRSTANGVVADPGIHHQTATAHRPGSRRSERLWRLREADRGATED
jgi:hypothetical protein